ncbi:MAG: hypothetical protein JXR37_20545 [Kiritimatiellae bacterium]|nr:hypothetical protein [Kiritimatiellia bacterium]
MKMTHIAAGLLTLFLATAGPAAETRTELSYGGDKVLSNPKVLARTEERANIAHDAGVGTFLKSEFSREDWRWIQSCEIGTIEVPKKAGDLDEAPAAPAPSPAPPLLGVLSSMALLCNGAGFVFAVLCNAVLVGWVMSRVRRNVGRFPGSCWSARALGAAEQVLFVGAVILGHWGAIALWLLLRTAGCWRTWQEYSDPPALAEKMVNPFLLNAALSVMVGVTGGLMSDWLMAGHFYGWALPAAVVAGLLALGVWARVAGRAAGAPPWAGGEAGGE